MNDEKKEKSEPWTTSNEITWLEWNQIMYGDYDDSVLGFSVSSVCGALDASFPDSKSLALASFLSSKPQFSSVMIWSANSFIKNTVKSPRAPMPILVYQILRKLSAKAALICDFSGSAIEGMVGIIAYEISTPCGNWAMNAAGSLVLSPFWRIVVPIVIPIDLRDCDQSEHLRGDQKRKLRYTHCPSERTNVRSPSACALSATDNGARIGNWVNV